MQIKTSRYLKNNKLANEEVLCVYLGLWLGGIEIPLVVPTSVYLGLAGVCLVLECPLGCVLSRLGLHTDLGAVPLGPGEVL